MTSDVIWSAKIDLLMRTKCTFTSFIHDRGKKGHRGSEPLKIGPKGGGRDNEIKIKLSLP